jgi:hypothetical protein
MEPEKNKEWLRLATDAFTDSTDHWENNYNSQWEDNIRMFQGRHPKGSKYNNAIYEKRSKIFRPKTRSAGIKAAL